MSPSDHSTSAAAVQRTALLDRLRAAGEEGLSVSDMVDAGGMWWRKRVDELGRLGYLVSEDRGYCHLVSEREVESGSRVVPDDGTHHLPLSQRAPTDSAVALSPEPLSLFPSGSSHYETESEAA